MNDDTDCQDCITHDGLCAWHARGIAQLAQINWKKLIGSSIVHETNEDAGAARERQEAERKAAEESKTYRQSIPAPKPTRESRFWSATTGTRTGRNRKAA